jgi:hypothetical protein
MRTLRLQPGTVSLLAFAVLTLSAAGSARASEFKGAAILDHACGKTSVQQMALVHAGTMEESLKLGTPEMQAQWKAMPAEDQKMMAGMMKDMSQSEPEFKAAIQAGGLLVVDGGAATLTVKKENKDANGSSTQSMTQRFVIDAKGCWISR